MVRACQPSDKAALIYRHSGNHRRKEALAGPNGMVAPRSRRLPSSHAGRRVVRKWCAAPG